MKIIFCQTLLDKRKQTKPKNKINDLVRTADLRKNVPKGRFN